jgi:hypothetical protein
VKSFQAQTHYEVLEVSVGASTEEIRAAYARLSRLYADEQVALYGLVDPERAQMLRERLKQAVDVLTDDVQRDAYDAAIGLPPREISEPKKPSPPVAAVTPATSAGVTTGAWPRDITWVTGASAAPPSVPSANVFSVPVGSAAATPVPTPVEPPRPSQSPRAPTHDSHHAAATPESEASAEAGAVVANGAAPPKLDVPAAARAPIDTAPVETVPLPERAPTDARGRAAAPVAAESTAEPPVPRLSDDAEVSIVPARATPREYRAESRPKPYEVPAGVEFNGDLLRQVRMARGLSLLQLSERTRISVRHLENVEGDRYEALPAPVYLRGILMSVARELGLDGLRVSKSYLAFVEAHRAKG